MSKKLLLAAVLAAAPALAFAEDIATPAAATPPTTVEIHNMHFEPAALTIVAGTTVTWVNDDHSPHTVTDKGKVFRSAALDTVLDRIADHAEGQARLRSRAVSAMTYPAIMAVVGGAIVLFLLAYVVPQVTRVFAEAKQTLPLPTRVLIATGDLLAHYGWLIPPLAILAVVAVRRAMAVPASRMRLETAFYRIPGVGSVARDVAVARFAQTLGVGVSMQRHVGNVWILLLAEAQPEATLVEMASLLEMDADVRYADAVLRRFTQAAAPNSHCRRPSMMAVPTVAPKSERPVIDSN